MNRRQLIRSLVGASVLPVFGFSPAAAASTAFDPSGQARIILPPHSGLPFSPGSRSSFEYRLGRAVLEFIEDNYAGRRLPIWGKRPDEIDLEKRIVNIVYWVVRGVERNQSTYSVDPVWIMAQIMAESFFYEFAVSWAFAVGVCQFIPRTAEHHGMTTANTSALQPTRLEKAELAGELDRYLGLRKKRKRLWRQHLSLFRSRDKVLREALEAADRGERMSRAGAYLQALDEADRLHRAIGLARDNYRGFLRANFEGRSIFNRKDLRFLSDFDERVLYAKPISAMTQIMARHLKARNGNILAATAGYNAGLGRTRYRSRIYDRYGRIPAIEETVNYVSRILIKHHEILQRL